MLFRFVGGHALMYPDYVDISTGRMLEPQPGETAVYDIQVAPGRNPTLPLPPGDGRWHAVSDGEGEDTPPEDEPGESPPDPAEVAPDGAESPPEAPEVEVPPEPSEPAAEPATDPEGSD